ncbi:TPA: hypothetical protein R4X78_000147 [Klebsiella variicola subsp. variicola]|nr:hypothetical protein [Klebsiella variicola subsp. variicola]
MTGKPYIVRIPGENAQQTQSYLHTLLARTNKTVPVAEKSLTRRSTRDASH